MRNCHPWSHLSPSAKNRKSFAAQYVSTLCRLLHPQLHDVGKSRHELPVGRLTLFGTDSVAEVAHQHVHVPTAPGHFHQMADGPLHPGCGGVEPGCQLGIETIY